MHNKPRNIHNKPRIRTKTLLRTNIIIKIGNLIKQNLYFLALQILTIKI